MRLRRLQQEFPRPLALAHKAFLLLPEDRPRQFTAYHLQHRQAARQMTGLPYDLPPVGTPYPLSSTWALEAAKWVEQNYPERFDRFDLALFEAFFEKTLDISSVEVLTQLAAEQGLPGGDLAAALQAHRYREAVWTDYREALEMGITGIPTVLIGDYAISGAVPYEQYLQAAQGLSRRL